MRLPLLRRGEACSRRSVDSGHCPPHERRSSRKQQFVMGTRMILSSDAIKVTHVPNTTRCSPLRTCILTASSRCIESVHLHNERMALRHSMNNTVTRVHVDYLLKVF